jgi:hypothetical protein
MKKFLSFIYILVLIVAPFSLVSPLSAHAASACNVSSAQWNPGGQQTTPGWFVEHKTQANVVVTSTGCVGQTLEFSVTQVNLISNTDLSDSGLSKKPIVVPSDNFTINLLLGEEGCSNTQYIVANCHLYTQIYDQDGNKLHDSGADTNGNLYYNCDGACNTNAAFLGITTADKAVDVNAQNNVASQAAANDTYTPLAPIGGVTSVKTNDIGTYINTMFELGIGLCAAIAVIMIIIYAIAYMGNESVFGKIEAKGRIFAAFLGLFIALAAYALLNTINPALTGQNGLQVGQVTAQIDPEVETAPPVNDTTTAGDSKLCTSGYVNVPTYGTPSVINVCSSLDGIPIATNLKNMLVAAKANNIILSGWGSRTYARQVQLRSDHGCPDPTTPSSSCHPPTARPGHSNHEAGGAVDFTCSGKSMANSACFVWLQQHAATYHFINLSSEPWHWSYNGK